MSNIITTQYNNTSIKIQYRNKETGDFIDLNGYTLFFIVKNLNDNFNNDSQAVIKKEYLIENSVDGYFTINLSSAISWFSCSLICLDIVALFNPTVLT